MRMSWTSGAEIYAAQFVLPEITTIECRLDLKEKNAYPKHVPLSAVLAHERSFLSCLSSSETSFCHSRSCDN
jgi:hypothetical protein